MKSMYPLTVTDKLMDCKKFYVELFDFEPVFETDWYIQLLHKQSGVELAFMLPHLDNQPTELHASFSGKGMVYSFEVDSATEEYARIKKLNMPFIHPLKTEEWGQTHFILQDPCGVYVDVVEQSK